MQLFEVEESRTFQVSNILKFCEQVHEEQKC